MTRRYNLTRIKTHRVYSVAELMKLLGVNKNTVSNWVKSGLTPSDNQTPYIFRGALVKRFHAARQRRAATRRLLPGEFKCFSCNVAVRPPTEAVRVEPLPSGRPWLRSTCPECGGGLNKPGLDADMAVLEGEADPNTSRDQGHEEGGAVPVGIGIEDAPDEAPVHTSNDRTIGNWQIFAKKHSTKTQDNHLQAIREFETFLAGKRFETLKQADADGFRAHLRGRLHMEGQGALSKSTVSHRLSHVSDFLTWLVKQDGFEVLPQDLPDYLNLSRDAYAKALRRKRREYPDIEVAEEMLASMPAATLVHRRNRAMFAIAFLGALREGTITSLRIEHVRIEDRVIVQDGTVSRTKNGKSLLVHWFPVGEAITTEVTRWVEELRGLGGRPEDALFPAAEWLGMPLAIGREGRQTIPVMTSDHAIGQAFRTASKTVAANYTPHSAKHSIGALRDQLPLTHEQRKAWSQNMGHEKMEITDQHYAQISDERCAELFEDFSSERSQGEALGISDADLEKLYAAKNALDEVFVRIGRTARSQT